MRDLVQADMLHKAMQQKVEDVAKRFVAQHEANPQKIVKLPSPADSICIQERTPL